MEVRLFLLQLQRGKGIDGVFAVSVARVHVALERIDIRFALALQPPAETEVAVVGIEGRAQVGKGPLATLREHHRRFHLQAEEVAILPAHLATYPVIGAVTQTIDHPVALHLFHHHGDGHGLQVRVFLQRNQVGQRTGRAEIAGITQTLLETLQGHLGVGISLPEGTQVFDDAGRIA